MNTRSMTEVKKVLMAPQGPQFSELVQGYWRMAEWNMSAQEHLSFLKQHVELGITTVDHAHVYGDSPSCEELFGAALRLEPAMREQIQIVSKCGIKLTRDDNKHVNHYDSSPQAIVDSVDESLRRLGVEQLDVLLIHRPDWLMEAELVADTFNALFVAGKVAHFGVSNFTTSQWDLLQSTVGSSLVTNQVEINPVNLGVIHDGTLDRLQQEHVRPMAWSCLAGGRVFYEHSEQMDRLRETLQDIAHETDADYIDQVVYAWVMALPSHPVAIIGSGNIERVHTAVNSLSVKLTREQWYRIWVASMGHGVP